MRLIKGAEGEEVGMAVIEMDRSRRIKVDSRIEIEEERNLLEIILNGIQLLCLAGCLSLWES